MNLWYSWQDSLQIFRLSQLKIYSLLVLKNILSTYRLFFMYGWWLLVGEFIIDATLNALYHSIQASALMIVLFSCLKAHLYPVTVFLFALLTRASVDIKNGEYIKKYSYYLFTVFCMYYLFVLLYAFFNHWELNIADIWYFFGNMCFIFATFFTLEKKYPLRSILDSIIQGWSMVGFNLPLFIIIGCIWYLSEVYVGFSLINVQAGFVNSVIVILCSTLYIKRLFEQYSFYIAAY